MNCYCCSSCKLKSHRNGAGFYTSAGVQRTTPSEGFGFGGGGGGGGGRSKASAHEVSACAAHPPPLSDGPKISSSMLGQRNKRSHAALIQAGWLGGGHPSGAPTEQDIQTAEYVAAENWRSIRGPPRWDILVGEIYRFLQAAIIIFICGQQRCPHGRGRGYENAFYLCTCFLPAFIYS